MSDRPDATEDSLRPRIERYLRETGVNPAEVDLSRLAGDASSRVYFRASRGGHLSRLIVLHPTPFTPEALPQIVVGRLLARLDIPIPNVLDAAGKLGVLVVEDVGDATLHTWLAEGHDPEPLYSQAVNLIARLQSAQATTASQGPPFNLAFDVPKLTWELNFFRSEFLEAHRQIHLDSAQSGVLTEEFECLASQLAAEPRVLCHRDYHSRNLMVRDGNLVVIDFQDARLGPATYDLVSLLRDCYVELPDTLSERLLHRYLTLAPNQAGADFRLRFDRMSIQRHLKALGTFGHQVAVRGRRSFNEAIPRTLGYLRRTLHGDSSYGRLLEVLASVLPELR
ncbi:MAG: hypothetical protein CL483_14920 [Acidobacteria bacterium]|nr:hypothetical protein [Acidobacteriota bacterium]|tara:strand:- start:1469 stop:2482 length:1014 start_codon:yes stop_codon:yes gene_type:complete